MKSTRAILGFILLAIGGCGGFEADNGNQSSGTPDGQTCANFTIDMPAGAAGMYLMAPWFFLIDQASVMGTTELQYMGGNVRIVGGAESDLSFVRTISFILIGPDKQLLVNVYDCSDCMAGTDVDLVSGPVDLLSFIKEEGGVWLAIILYYGEPATGWTGDVHVCAAVQGSFSF